jgi:hypothetical protein
MDTVLSLLSRLVALALPPPGPVLVPIRVTTDKYRPSMRMRHAPQSFGVGVWPNPKPRSRIRQALRPCSK